MVLLFFFVFIADDDLCLKKLIIKYFSENVHLCLFQCAFVLMIRLSSHGCIK